MDAGEGRTVVWRVPPMQGRGERGDCWSRSGPESKYSAEESGLRFPFDQHEMINKEVLRETALKYYERHREEAKLFHSLVCTRLYYLAVCRLHLYYQDPVSGRRVSLRLRDFHQSGLCVPCVISGKRLKFSVLDLPLKKETVILIQLLLAGTREKMPVGRLKKMSGNQQI